MQTAPVLDADAELVRRAQRGDRRAFEAIYRRYVRRVYNLALRMVAPAQEAEDLTQEVFLQVYRNLRAFEGRSTLYTWIHTIACNTCLQFRKKLRRLRRLAPLDELAEAQLEPLEPGPGRGPEREAERRQTMEHVARAIDDLPAPQRMMLVLGPIQGHDYESMARLLEVTTAVVKARMHRARRALQRVLDGHEGS